LRVVQAPVPDGSTLEIGIIDHPGSVVLVPLEGQEVLMLRQYRLALDREILELPAGTRHADEAWLNCAQRELREETGFRAGKLTPLGKVWPAPGFSNELMAIYLAEDLHPAPLPADPDEQIVVEKWPLEKLIEMALAGQLQDGKSIIGIMQTAAHLGIWPV
jgi:ADP-ribose pyrophosphatase